MTDYGPEAFRSVAALYAAKGWRVLPIKPRSKLPAIADWPRLATTDPGQLDRWWANGASYGIGIATGPESGVFALDVDDDGGRTKRGDDTLAEILRNVDPLPDTPTVLTPSGGRHLYWRWPPGVSTLGLTAGQWLDIRGAGHQCVAPPSLHPNGQRYVWDTELRPSRVPVAEAPDWLLDLIVVQGTAGHSTDEDDGFALVLSTAGWTLTRTDHRGEQHWARPRRTDEPAGDHSATLYPSPDLRLVIWSTSVPGVRVSSPYFEPDDLARDLGVAPPDAADGPTTSSRGRVRSLGELLAADETEYEWLVPGLLERGDRVIVTGPEGYGKSTLLRQMGVGAALGENTLTINLVDRVHPACIVLLVDLENTPRQLRREFEKLLGGLAPDQRDRVTGGVFVESRPEGLVLDVRKDPEKDRSWLEEAIDDTKPDLLIVGPVYKMIDGEPNDEPPNRELVKWLDRLRVAHDLTILLEAHTPHDQRRPYGWSGWKRWPEFGFHLHEDGRLQHWRGQRDERAWPQKLSRGGSGRWLWIPDLGTTSEPASDAHEDLIARCKVEVLRYLNKVDRALTGNELAELIGRQKASVLAAIAQLREGGALVVEDVEVMRSNGRPQSVKGYRPAPNFKA